MTKHTITTAFDRAAELAADASESNKNTLAALGNSFPRAKRENIIERLRSAQKEKVTGEGASFGNVKITAKVLDRLTPLELSALRGFWRLVETESLLDAEQE